MTGWRRRRCRARRSSPLEERRGDHLADLLLMRRDRLHRRGPPGRDRPDHVREEAFAGAGLGASRRHSGTCPWIAGRTTGVRSAANALAMVRAARRTGSRPAARPEERDGAGDVRAGGERDDHRDREATGGDMHDAGGCVIPSFVVDRPVRAERRDLGHRRESGYRPDPTGEDVTDRVDRRGHVDMVPVLVASHRVADHRQAVAHQVSPTMSTIGRPSSSVRTGRGRRHGRTPPAGRCAAGSPPAGR